MQLIHHLNDEEQTDLLLETDQVEMQKTFAALPEQLRSTTERPEWFWQKQQNAIRDQMPAARRTPWQLPVTSAGAVVLVILATILLHHGRPPTPQARTISDQELMIAVERAVQSDGPEALAPAALLANEISNNLRPATGPHHNSEENRNED